MLPDKLTSLALFAMLPAGAFAAPQSADSSSQSPYLVPTRGGVVTRAILTVGDAVNYKPDSVTPYRMVGIPNGLGAFDNGDGTFTLVMNHELPVNISGPVPGPAGVATPVGIIRAHGNAGAFVSMWTIDKTSLQVLKGEDLVQNNTSMFLSNNDPSTDTAHTGYLPGGTTAISRLCSGDLAAPTAYSWIDPVTGTFYGTTARMQAHYNPGDAELVEGGQLLALHFAPGQEKK